jgi:endonuclease/exonuclease/phosphatase family metal-dependent hydrolase
MTLRVAVLNLHQGFKRWQERRELIIGQLGTLRPDILALNEISVPLETGRWLWKEARERYGFRYALLQQTKSDTLSLDEAQGLLTRFPVVETRNFDYLARGRVAQVVRLEIEGRLADVYVTHLHHVSTEDGLRQYEVKRLFDWVDSRDDVETRIVCGDFNATPEALSIRMIPRSFRSVQTSGTCPTGLRVLGEHASELDATSALFLSQCVDYIWVTEDIVIEKAGRCFDQPAPNDLTLWPSDHVGVWADLRFR